MIPSGRQNPILGGDPKGQRTMPLDLTVSSTNLTDDNSLETFQPYDLGNGDDLININNEFLDKNDYEEDPDPEKYNVLEILNEMRLEEPLGDDIHIGFHNNNDLAPYHNFNLADSTKDFSTYYNNTIIKSNVVDEYKTEDEPINNDQLDLLLYPESCSTPDVQLEVIDSTVQFEYDAREQFDCALDMELSYPDVPDRTVYAADVENNNVNKTTYKTSNNETEPSHPEFVCSTKLPMTRDEVDDDVRNTFKQDPNNRAALFYDYSDTMFNDYSNNLTEIENMDPYGSDTLPNNIKEQNRLFENFEAVNPIEPIEIPTALPVYNFQCDSCSYKAKSKHGLSKHSGKHLMKRYKCQHCHFRTGNRYSLKHHSKYNHQRKYTCPKCNFFTRSSTRIKRHLRKRH